MRPRRGSGPNKPIPARSCWHVIKSQATQCYCTSPHLSDGIASAGKVQARPEYRPTPLTVHTIQHYSSTHIIQQQCSRTPVELYSIGAHEPSRRNKRPTTRLPGLENLRLSHGYGTKCRTPLAHRLRRALLAGDVIELWFVRSQGHARGTCENQALDPRFLAALDHSAHA